MIDLELLQSAYADLLVTTGVNLQPGQCLYITAELAHAPFVRQVAAAAYRAGAPYVNIEWSDTLLQRARLLNSAAEHLTYYPDYDTVRYRQMVDDGWARLALTGAEFPDGLDDVDPKLLQQVSVTRRRKLRFYSEALMANQLQWCVAAVPTVAWAQKVFPALTPDNAVEKLWRTILQVCRVDLPDPRAAWQSHDRRLQQLAAYVEQQQVRTLRFVDQTLATDGRPRTQLTIGLTDRPAWVAASSQRPDGVRFLPNMPTEELFSTPHAQRVDGWLRTSKPAFPFDRRVDDAYIRFVDGEVVEFTALTGQEVLAQLFAIEGARRLGEVALVDVRSPINQAGIIFYDTLFDENAVCHIAFGEAYPGGVVGGDGMSADELTQLGVNRADTHVDMMIGTETMQVEAVTADGRTVPLMLDGRFVIPAGG